MPPFLDRLAAPFVRSHFGATGRALGLPRPDDAPTAHAPGSGADRILVFGNGAAVGWGVRSHDAALPGHLARSLARRTGRGADVDAVADPALTIETVGARLRLTNLASIDAIVVVVGVSDALRLTSERRWRAGLLALFDAVTEGADPAVEVVMVGIHRPSTIRALTVAPGSLVDRHADRLDAITRAFCDARDRTHFVEPPATPPPVELDDSHTSPAALRFAGDAYRLWAEGHAEVLAPLLDGRADVHADGGAHARDRPQTNDVRLAAIRALGLLDSPPEKRFDDITERTRLLLGTSGAAFSIVDENRLYNKSFSGVGAVEVPLRGAMCAVTIQSGEPFVVPDVWHDDRFVTHPAVRFYAGHPVETPDGIRIGALCVTDPNPRGADSVDLVLLRELALSVQRELAVTVGPVPAAA